MSEPLEKMYSVSQVAEMFSVTAETVRDWCVSGRLHAIKPGGRMWRIPHSSVAALANSKYGDA